MQNNRHINLNNRTAISKSFLIERIVKNWVGLFVSDLPLKLSGNSFLSIRNQSLECTKIPFQPRFSLQCHVAPLAPQDKTCKGLGNTLMEKLIRKVSTKEQTGGSCKHQYISGHCLQNLVWIPEKKRNRKDSPVLPRHPLQEQQTAPFTTVNKIWKQSEFTDKMC